MPERISWKDSNLALIGSELDHKVKAAAAQGEAAWQGMGQKPETKIWRIEKFQVVPWPRDKYGEFHKGDSYLILNTCKDGTSDALHHDIHMWIGSESSQDEYGTAAYKMVEADEFLGGTPVQHRQIQGHETNQFLAYFDAIEYLDGGIESGFKHVEPDEEYPVLFRVKGTKKKRTLTQIPVSKSSLNDGDSFILCAGKAKVWCWHGQKARPLEKADSNVWAENMCTLGTAVVLDQGQGDDEDTEFWNYLGDGEIQPAQDDDDEGETEFAPLLYRVDGEMTKDLELVATGTPIQETSTQCTCLHKSDLHEDDVFLVDSGWEIYVWIGKGADHYEKIAAMTAADKYSKMGDNSGRTLELPVHIVKSGHELNRFLSYFA